MTLPSTGQISMSQVNSEIGWASNRAISLNDAAVRALAGRGSGTSISMSHLRGKTYWAASGTVTVSPTTSSGRGTGFLNISTGPMAGAMIRATQFQWTDGSYDLTARVENWPVGLSTTYLRQVQVGSTVYTPYSPSGSGSSFSFRLATGSSSSFMPGSSITLRAK